jgi:hypothetical protein
MELSDLYLSTKKLFSNTTLMRLTAPAASICNRGGRSGGGSRIDYGPHPEEVVMIGDVPPKMLIYIYFMTITM